MTTLLWLTRDLRVHDHPALHAALDHDEQVVPVFCLDRRLLAGRHASGPRTGFLLESLADLDRALRERGSGLVVRRGIPENELLALARRLKARSVRFTADVGPFARSREQRLRRALRGSGVELRAHPGMFVVDDPASIRTNAGRPYTMFTPFHRAWTAESRRAVLPAPSSLPALPPALSRGTLPRLSELGLQQEVEAPLPGGEVSGRERADRFLSTAVARDGEDRSRLDTDGTSRLSPYLHFGCVSVRALEDQLPTNPGDAALRRQLCWRDFYAQVLFHAPRNARSEHQARYRGTINWSHAQRRFEAWCEGRTGYPLVDAAMRQLRREGWMHNRGRLLVGSFLTKDLGIDWRWGERWFMRLLLDGDEASNNGNWQWIASVGVDPQPPSRRLYNPTIQRERMDPDGSYVRTYVPELTRVPDEYLSEPWKMPTELQHQSGCVIGVDYPAPSIEHAQARREALERYSRAAGGDARAGSAHRGRPPTRGRS